MENPLAHFPQPELVDQPSAPVLASSNVPPLASPLPHSLRSRPPESFMHKNRLQEFTQRSSIQLPVYQTVNEGSVHAPQFRSSVLVDGVTYTSETTFSNRKAAEQDVAKHALECISKKLKDEGCPLIREDTVFCKSILNEFVVKMNLELPTYNTIQSGGVLPLFVSTLVFNGATYRGETGRNKKEAEQLAARVVIQSLLADDRYGTVVSEIIKSKAKLYDALNKAKDSSFDTTLAGANRLNHNNTEVENNAVTNHVPWNSPFWLQPLFSTLQVTMPSGAPPPLPPPPYTPSQQPPPPVLSPPPIRITRTKTPTGGILLGKYQLGRMLGQGSFAKVHEATSIDDGNTVVAIKVIDKTKTVDAAMEPRIISEVSAMRRLQHHPNILKIHEVMATKTKIYLVMELATGGELFGKLLNRGRLSEGTARRYFTQLVSALHFCHQNGVAHRDMKPQNVLLDKNGNVKVSDFGLSALPEQLHDGLLHTACGTPAYTAPEVARSKPYEGSKADAWSCGVILFVMLAGYLPFDDHNLIGMYKKIARREYKFPKWISKQTRAIIWQLLDPNPDTRMTLDKVMETSWIKKALATYRSSHKENESLLHGRKLKHEMICNGVNAFDIISLSSGLDLSGLFEGGNDDIRKEKRYTTSMEVDEVMERVMEAGERMGYRVEKGKRGVLGLGKGKVVLTVEVVEIAELFVLVEVKVVEGTVEFDEGQWLNLETGLGDLFVSWDDHIVGD